MALPITTRWLAISLLAIWNILGGSGFYAYVLDSYGSSC